MAKFLEVFEDVTKYGTKIPTDKYLASGEYPIIDQGQTYISGYINDGTGLFTDVPAIIFGDHTRVLKYVDTPCFLGADGVKLLKTKDNSSDYKYLYYALCNANIPNTGYNRHFKWLKEVNIPLPNVETQHQIANTLDKVTHTIDICNAILEKLDLLVKSRFVEMFGDIDLNPFNWEKAPMGNYMSLLTDFSANGSYEYLDSNVIMYDEPNYALMVRTTDLEKNDFVNDVKYIDEKAYNILSKSKIFGNEIIMNKIGSAGKVYLMPILNKPVSLGRNAFMFRFNEEINIIFLYHLLISEYGAKEIQQHVRGAVTKTITKEAARSVRIIIPPLALQQQFAAFVEQTDKTKQQVKMVLEKAETLKKALMQEYFG